MKPREVLLLDDAVRDLRAIHDHVRRASESRRVAESYLKKIRHHLRPLAYSAAAYPRFFHQSGKVQTTVDILLHGLVRGFFLDRAGKEVTDCIALVPGTPLVSGFELGGASVISLEAVEETTMVSLPLAQLAPLLQEPELVRLYLEFQRDSLRKHWRNKLMLVQYTAQERYLWFVKEYPGVIDKMSHKHIASFLGMTPVSLSRIRRSLRDGELSVRKRETP